MPKFIYQGVDDSGQIDSGTLNAGSERLAFDTLQSRGITVFELAPEAERSRAVTPWYRRQLGSQKELPLDQQAAIADLLSSLFASHLSVTQVIQVATLGIQQKEIASQFKRMEQRVADGDEFSVAFEAESRKFNPLFTSFLKVSDASNALPQLLKQLADFLRSQHAVRQQFASAMIYPAILAVVSLALMSFVIFYLAPNLKPIFTSVGQEPPGALSTLLKINASITENSTLYLLLTGLACTVLMFLSQSNALKASTIRLISKMPIIGEQIRVISLTRLTKSLSMLLQSGLTLSEALKTSAAAMGGVDHQIDTFKKAAQSVEAGGSAASAFEADGQIPSIYKELFKIGEQANQLPDTLEMLSRTYAEQLKSQTQRLVGLITPSITLLIGGGVGLLVYSIMGAILEVNQIAF